MTTLFWDYEHKYKDIIILHPQPYNMEPENHTILGAMTI